MKTDNIIEIYFHLQKNNMHRDRHGDKRNRQKVLVSDSRHQRVVLRCRDTETGDDSRR